MSCYSSIRPSLWKKSLNGFPWYNDRHYTTHEAEQIKKSYYFYERSKILKFALQINRY